MIVLYKCYAVATRTGIMLNDSVHGCQVVVTIRAGLKKPTVYACQMVATGIRKLSNDQLDHGTKYKKFYY